MTRKSTFEPTEVRYFSTVSRIRIGYVEDTDDSLGVIYIFRTDHVIKKPVKVSIIRFGYDEAEAELPDMDSVPNSVLAVYYAALDDVAEAYLILRKALTG